MDSDFPEENSVKLMASAPISRRLPQRAGRHLRAESNEADAVSDAHAEKRNAHRFAETMGCIANKLTPATMPVHFFKTNIEALEKDRLWWEEI